MRPLGAWSPFELCVRTILGQQVTVAAAGTLMRRLVERCGTVTPECVADANFDSIGMPGKRVETIRSFARAAADGRVDFERPWTEVEAALKAAARIRALDAGLSRDPPRARSRRVPRNRSRPDPRGAGRLAGAAAGAGGGVATLSGLCSDLFVGRERNRHPGVTRVSTCQFSSPGNCGRFNNFRVCRDVLNCTTASIRGRLNLRALIDRVRSKSSTNTDSACRELGGRRRRLATVVAHAVAHAHAEATRQDAGRVPRARRGAGRSAAPERRAGSRRRAVAQAIFVRRARRAGQGRQGVQARRHPRVGLHGADLRQRRAQDVRSQDQSRLDASATPRRCRATRG